MAESQPTFSLIPDPAQNKEDKSLISVVTYGAYIPHFTFDSILFFTKPNFREDVQDPGDPAKPWIRDPSGLLPIFMGFKSLNQKKSSVI